MKLKLSQIRKIIREELTQPLQEINTQSNTLKNAFSALSNAFPVVVTNQIISQKFGKNLDNRTRQLVAQKAQQHVDAAKQQFESELQALIEKFVSQTVSSYEDSGELPKAEPTEPDTGPNPDQRKTVMRPPSME